MIARIWHGWTTAENADAYEKLLTTEIFPAIEEKSDADYRGIRLLRRELEDEVEFITIMQFESLDAVRKFAGEDHEAAHVPDAARKLLKRFDDRSQHYDVVEEIEWAKKASSLL